MNHGWRRADTRRRTSELSNDFLEKKGSLLELISLSLEVSTPASASDPEYLLNVAQSSLVQVGFGALERRKDCRCHNQRQQAKKLHV